MHSPWISRFLAEQGARVFVANPRKLAVLLLSLWRHGADYDPQRGLDVPAVGTVV